MSLRVSRVLEQLATTWPIVLICPPGGESAAANGVKLVAEVNFPNLEQWMYVPSQYDIRPVVQKVRETVEAFDPTIALLWGGMEYLRQHIPAMPPSVSDRVDSMTLSAWRMLLRSPNLQEFQSRLAHLAYVARYEFTTRDASQAMTVVGDADATVLTRFLRVKNVHVIPNGVDASPRLGERSAHPTVMFTGVLNYTPNVDAVMYFADTVWPSIRAQLPQAVLQLVGRSPAPEIVALRSRPGIEIHANVHSVPAMLAQAWVAVAPMRSGCGIKNKVLEAWSVGTPAVMTPIATNGLTQAPEALLLTAEGEAMSSLIVDLLNDPGKRQALGTLARATATDRFSWRSAGTAVSALLEKTLQSTQTLAR